MYVCCFNGCIANIENMYVPFQKSIGGEGLYAYTRGSACKFFKRWMTSSSTSKSSIVPKKVGKCSVADPGYLSPIPDPDFYPSLIPDLGSRIKKQQQKTGENFVFVKPFFVATNFTKLNIIFFDMLKKKICPNFPRIIEVLTQKIVTKPSKIWVWDP